MMNSIKLQNIKGNIFMNSENSKTSDSYRQNREKINLKRSDKYVAPKILYITKKLSSLYFKN